MNNSALFCFNLFLAWPRLNCYLIFLTAGKLGMFHDEPTDEINYISRFRLVSQQEHSLAIQRDRFHGQRCPEHRVGLAVGCIRRKKSMSVRMPR